jgi:hypothetical protein
MLSRIFSCHVAGEIKGKAIYSLEKPDRRGNSATYRLDSDFPPPNRNCLLGDSLDFDESVAISLSSD